MPGWDGRESQSICLPCICMMLLAYAFGHGRSTVAILALTGMLLEVSPGV